MKKLQMLAVGACLAMCLAAAEKELAYRVRVDGVDVPLLSETVKFGSKHPDGKVAFEGPYWFGSFVITNAVTVTVDCTLPLNKMRVLPMSAGISPSLQTENRISFKADKPFKISIERDGRQSPLLLFADAPEKDAPAPNAPKVRYFGPGSHAAGRIDLTDGETLYLAAGAVVNGCVRAKGENITICGRGLLTGDAYPRFKGPGRYLLDLVDCRNVTVRDVMLSGAFSWALVLSNCDGAVIDNVKMMNSNMINDDAVDICNSRNVTVRNSFVRAQDDIIAVKGMGADRDAPPTRDILVENCIFWTDRANAFRIGYECNTEEMENIRARNIDVIHCSKDFRPPSHYWSNAIVWLQPSNGLRLSDCTFEDMRVNVDEQGTILVQAEPRVCRCGGVPYKTAGQVRACTFKNITVEGLPDKDGKRPPSLIVVRGPSGKENVRNVTFENVRCYGEPAKEDSPFVAVGPHAVDVVFKE